MRYILATSLSVLTVLSLNGQIQTGILEGKVSYITSQNVYVSFQSTKDITIGDTLFLKQGDLLTPVLTVTNLSSISCVCTPVSEAELKLSDIIWATPAQEQTVTEKPEVLITDTLQPSAGKQADTLADITHIQIESKQEIHGRLSVSSYTDFSDSPGPDSQRMRYTFSLQANRIGDSKFSAESYISFVHSNLNWDKIKDDVFNGLKIYNLAVRYNINESSRILIGRKINPKLSSLGAIDGLQAEKAFKSLTVGAFAGWRPDYSNYSFNADLFQFGAYLAHGYMTKNGDMQTTVAFVQQYNDFKTDRRFAYFQHSNTLIKGLYFIGTMELDLYKMVDSTPQADFNLTNLYLSLRYSVIKTLSISASYSARQNIIYYETFKSFIDKVLETETLQGWRAQINYRPIRYFSVGINGGYRHQKADPIPSKNISGYLTYSRLPVLNMAVTATLTFLETSYLSGKIYGLGLSRELVPGKLSGGLNYRYVDYRYLDYEMTTTQHIGEVNLTWNIYKKLSCSLNYEGTFEDPYFYNRIYTNLAWRF